MTIDTLFEQSAAVVAKELIGRIIETDHKQHVISATKAYVGKSKSKTSMERLPAGRIMMLSFRGYAHLCVSTGKDSKPEYVFIYGLRAGEPEIDKASKVCKALNISMEANNRPFSRYFKLIGNAQTSDSLPVNLEADTCVAAYKLPYEDWYL